MRNKTEGVKELVEEVLAHITAPYSEDIIEEVFVHIGSNHRWEKRYEELSADLREDWIVNNWIGKYTKILTGYETGKQVKAQNTGLITSYSKLIPV